MPTSRAPRWCAVSPASPSPDSSRARVQAPARRGSPTQLGAPLVDRDDHEGHGEDREGRRPEHVRQPGQGEQRGEDHTCGHGGAGPTWLVRAQHPTDGKQAEAEAGEQGQGRRARPDVSHAHEGEHDRGGERGVYGSGAVEPGDQGWAARPTTTSATASRSAALAGAGAIQVP